MPSTKDKTKITLGPVQLEWKEYDGDYETNFTNIGFVTDKGAIYEYKGDTLKVKSGNRLGTTKIMLIGEEATLEVACEEFTVQNIATALGIPADDIADDDVNHYLYVLLGGASPETKFTLKLTTHISPSIDLVINLYCCQISPDFKLDLSPEKVVEIPVKFKALGDENASMALGYIRTLAR
jgi:hypothetical protein